MSQFSTCVQTSLQKYSQTSLGHLLLPLQTVVAWSRHLDLDHPSLEIQLPLFPLTPPSLQAVLSSSPTLARLWMLHFFIFCICVACPLYSGDAIVSAIFFHLAAHFLAKWKTHIEMIKLSGLPRAATHNKAEIRADIELTLMVLLYTWCVTIKETSVPFKDKGTLPVPHTMQSEVLFAVWSATIGPDLCLHAGQWHWMEITWSIMCDYKGGIHDCLTETHAHAEKNMKTTRTAFKLGDSANHSATALLNCVLILCHDKLLCPCSMLTVLPECWSIFTYL